MWWFLPVLALLALGCLALATVLGWIDDNKSIGSCYGELIKQRLSDGRYRVVAGVFNRSDQRTAYETWETDEIDEDLEDYFDGRNRCRVEI
jgi:hypothetical protein